MTDDATDGLATLLTVQSAFEAHTIVAVLKNAGIEAKAFDAEDASFGLPEVERGALGAAPHLARMVPQHKMRAMVYTCARASAAELHAFGSVLEVVPRDGLVAAARRVAADIASKPPRVVRAAKACLNGIDPIDVKRSYRFEQGFTFELNLIGAGDEAREAWIKG